LAHDGDQARERTLLEAVSLLAERLLGGSDAPAVPDMLQVLGPAADVSRLALVAARSGSGSAMPRMEGRQQWAAAGIARLQPGPDGWARYPARWRDELARGSPIIGPTRAFPDDERMVLEAVGARAVVMVPVLAGTEWYGHLACHDTRAERAWSPGEVDAMRAAAAIIGASIHQRRVQAEVERHAGLLRFVGVATSLLLEAGNWRQALPRVLDGLRTATRSRSAWAYGPDPDQPGRRAVLLYEVLAPGARPGGGRPRVLELPPEAVARLQVTGPLHDGLDTDDVATLQAAVAPRAGGSWAVTPMILEPGSTGLVGLEVDGIRDWADGELDALDIVAGALKAAIRRGSTLVSVPIVTGQWGRASAVGTPVRGDASRSTEATAPAQAPAPKEDTGNPG
jgi:GAF domain-containing protein